MKWDMLNMYRRAFDKALRGSDPELYANTTSKNVYQVAQRQNRPLFRFILEDLMLPGSTIRGYDNIKQMYDLALKGKSTLILSAHFTNFDVPALYALLCRHGKEGEDIFERIIFIAGRKLTEGSKYVKAMAEMFNRMVISAKASNMTPEEVKVAMAINKASQKMISKMKEKGYIFLIYPTGTRSRSHQPKSHHGLREIYNYIKKFDYYQCCGISGMILPARDDVPMMREYPKKEKIVYSFGRVRDTSTSLAELEAQMPADDDTIDKKKFVIDRVMDEIYSLGYDPRKASKISLIKYKSFNIALSNFFWINTAKFKYKVTRQKPTSKTLLAMQFKRNQIEENAIGFIDALKSFLNSTKDDKE